MGVDRAWQNGGRVRCVCVTAESRAVLEVNLAVRFYIVGRVRLSVWEEGSKRLFR